MQCLVDIGSNIKHHCDSDKMGTATGAYEERFVNPLVEESRFFVESFSCPLPVSLEVKYIKLSNGASRKDLKEDLLLFFMLKSVALKKDFCDFFVIFLLSRLKNLLFSCSIPILKDLNSNYLLFYFELTLFFAISRFEVLLVFRSILAETYEFINHIFLKIKTFQNYI